MSKRIAVIGDVHGIYEEFVELIRACERERVDEIWHTGDLVDRGPDSGRVVQLCRVLGIRGVAGNHDLVLRESHRKGVIPKNPDKARSFGSIRSPLDWDYLHALPFLHVEDSLNLVMVHGGILPKVALYRQPEALVCRLQLIHPDKPDHTYWFTEGRDGTPEQDYRARGYRRWYELYDHKEDVIFGHSVFKTPLVHNSGIEGAGTCFGIDQGGVFGGKLTALVYPDLIFLSVQGKKEYAGRVQGHDSSFGVKLHGE